MHGIMLLFHILGATVWTGGHIILATTILPAALRERSIERIQQFENRFERIGLPALLIQVLTGLHLAATMLGEEGRWFGFSDPVSRVVSIKLILLALTVLLAADARLRIIPRLTPHNLTALAWHIIVVTILSILFVIAGVSFRTGWLY